MKGFLPVSTPWIELYSILEGLCRDLANKGKAVSTALSSPYIPISQHSYLIAQSPFSASQGKETEVSNKVWKALSSQPGASLELFPGPSGMEGRSEAVQMCPRYPEPVPLDHPIPILKDALEKVCGGRMEGLHVFNSSLIPRCRHFLIAWSSVLCLYEKREN